MKIRPKPVLPIFGGLLRPVLLICSVGIWFNILSAGATEASKKLKIVLQPSHIMNLIGIVDLTS
jgi:hypothetical protein